MRRRRVLLLAVALVSAVAPALAVTATPAAGAQNWGDWMDQAYNAVETSQGFGAVVQAGDLSNVVRSDLALPDGSTVSVQQRTVLISDGTNELLIGMTVLGDAQEVVDVIDPTTGDDTTLVLAPESSQVNGSVHIHHRLRHRAPSATAASSENPLVAGGCYASPDAPFVIGSVYGPLIKGIGVVSCPYGNESLSVISSLYEKPSTHVGNNGSASVYGTYLAVDAYDACTPSTSHQFQTAQLWSVNGALQAGAASGWATLGCK